MLKNKDVLCFCCFHGNLAVWVSAGHWGGCRQYLSLSMSTHGGCEGSAGMTGRSSEPLPTIWMSFDPNKPEHWSWQHGELMQSQQPEEMMVKFRRSTAHLPSGPLSQYPLAGGLSGQTAYSTRTDYFNLCLHNKAWPYCKNVIQCNYKLHTFLNIIINAGNTCGLVDERQIKSKGVVCFAGRAQGDYSVSTSASTCVKWPRLNLPLLTCTVHFLLPPKSLHLLHPAVAVHLSSNMFFPLWSQYPEGKTHLQKYANVNIILLHLCYSIFILFLNSLMCKWMQHDSKSSHLQHMSHSEKFHSVVCIWSVLTQDVSIF